VRSRAQIVAIILSKFKGKKSAGPKKQKGGYSHAPEAPRAGGIRFGGGVFGAVTKPKSKNYPLRPQVQAPRTLQPTRRTMASTTRSPKATSGGVSKAPTKFNSVSFRSPFKTRPSLAVSNALVVGAPSSKAKSIRIRATVIPPAKRVNRHAAYWATLPSHVAAHAADER
jgi:hypothetical protein